MSALIALGWCVAGLLILIAGAELIVRGGSRLAAKLGISPLVVGLTVVAIGTSTPELAVGVEAALRGNGSLAVGNIAGTNIVNILFILGFSALLRPLALHIQTLRLDLPVMVVTAVAMLAMAWDGIFTRAEGAVLVCAAIAYTAVVIRSARRESAAVVAEFDEEYGVPRENRTARAVLRNLALLGAGIAVIVLGSVWLVEGAVDLARRLGVSESFIGLTIIAIGTSSPELVTTIVGTLRNERDIAIGNLLGSSVYNILVILGVTCLVPSAGIPIEPELVQVDIPIMTAVAFACMPVFLNDRRITRLEGGLFVGAYIVYLTYLVLVRT